jgi:hypothetical protein
LIALVYLLLGLPFVKLSKSLESRLSNDKKWLRNQNTIPICRCATLWKCGTSTFDSIPSGLNIGNKSTADDK